MKEALIAQAARIIEKIRTSPNLDEAEVEYLTKLVLYATEDAVELTESGASA
jgi:hypothetical protein